MSKYGFMLRDIKDKTTVKVDDIIPVYITNIKLPNGKPTDNFIVTIQKSEDDYDQYLPINSNYLYISTKEIVKDILSKMLVDNYLYRYKEGFVTVSIPISELLPLNTILPMIDMKLHVMGLLDEKEHITLFNSIVVSNSYNGKSSTYITSDVTLAILDEEGKTKDMVPLMLPLYKLSFRHSKTSLDSLENFMKNFDAKQFARSTDYVSTLMQLHGISISNIDLIPSILKQDIILIKQIFREYYDGNMTLLEFLIVYALSAEIISANNVNRLLEFYGVKL